MEILLGYVTCPSQKVAESLGEDLVKTRIIACYNSWPMQSGYWWDEQINHDQEWILLVKTRLELEQTLEAYVLAHHPYQVPCILRWKTQVNTSYGHWIFKETRSA